MYDLTCNLAVDVALAGGSVSEEYELIFKINEIYQVNKITLHDNTLPQDTVEPGCLPLTCT